MSNEYQTLDPYDRLFGSLRELPDVTATKPSTIQAVTPIIGTAQTFFITTFRQAEKGDTIFIQCVEGEKVTRLAIPPKVADAIARQRESLTGKVRSKIGRATAQARKDRGELPGFLQNKTREIA